MFTYSTSSTIQTLFGDGEFSNSPDQLIRGEGGEVIYLTEDGGKSTGVYAIDKSNKRYAIFEAYSQKYKGDGEFFVDVITTSVSNKLKSYVHYQL